MTFSRLLGIFLIVITMQLSAQYEDLPFGSILVTAESENVIIKRVFKQSFEDLSEINPALIWPLVKYTRSTSGRDDAKMRAENENMQLYKSYFLYKNYLIGQYFSSILNESKLSSREYYRIKSGFPSLESSSTMPDIIPEITVNDTLCYILVNYYSGTVYENYETERDYIQEYKLMLDAQYEKVNAIVANKSDNENNFNSLFLTELQNSFVMASAVGDIPEFEFSMNDFIKFLNPEKSNQFSVLFSFNYTTDPYSYQHTENYTLTDFASENFEAGNALFFDSRNKISLGVGIRYIFDNKSDYFSHVDALFLYEVDNASSVQIRNNDVILANPRYEYSTNSLFYYSPLAKIDSYSRFTLRLATPVKYFSDKFFIGAGIDFDYTKTSFTGGVLRYVDKNKIPSGINDFAPDEPKVKYTKSNFHAFPFINITAKISYFEIYSIYSFNKGIILGTQLGVEL